MPRLPGALGTTGVAGVPNLSRAMHSKHASDIEEDGDDGGGDGDAAPKLGGDDTAQLTNLIGWIRGKSLTAKTSGFSDPAAPVDEGTQDCYQCHPGEETSCLRGVMAEAGMWCTDCHGSMQDVASPDRTPWVDEPQCGVCHGRTTPKTRTPSTATPRVTADFTVPPVMAAPMPSCPAWNLWTICR